MPVPNKLPGNILQGAVSALTTRINIKKTAGLFTGILAAAGCFAQIAKGDNSTAAEFEQLVKTADRATRDLFPPSVSAAINPANATYYFPSYSTHVRLDGMAGIENFCILNSLSDSDIEALISTVRKPGITFFRGVKDKLRSR
jgi:hypothetical protein